MLGSWNRAPMEDFLLQYGPLGVAVSVLAGWVGLLHKEAGKVEAELSSLKQSTMTRSEFYHEMKRLREDGDKMQTQRHEIVQGQLVQVQTTLGRLERRLDNIMDER